MTEFTTMIHVTGSSRNFEADLEYLRAIHQTIYTNHATVFRDWLDVAASRHKKNIPDEEVEWSSILNENIEAIVQSDLVIVEASQSRFSQGLQAYLALQYKKPTLIVTRSEIKGHFISGVNNKYITVKRYATVAELQEIVTKFIKQNAIPERDLRFNMFLDRRIYKYLRDKSYETGKNKSDIIREAIQKEIDHRHKL